MAWTFINDQYKISCLHTYNTLLYMGMKLFNVYYARENKKSNMEHDKEIYGTIQNNM